MPEVRPGVRELHRRLPLHRHPQLGPENHPPHPAVHHYLLLAHRRPLHLQVQRHQGESLQRFNFNLIGLLCNDLKIKLQRNADFANSLAPTT